MNSTTKSQGSWVDTSSMVCSGEGQPLLRPMERIPTRHQIRRRCSLPNERVLVGAIAMLLLFVVTLLLIMKNMTATRNGNDLPIYPAFKPNGKNWDVNLVVDLENDSFKDAWEEGQKLVQRIMELELLLFQNGMVPSHHTASSRLQKFQKMTQPSKNVSYCAIIVEHVKRSLGNCVKEVKLPDYCEAPRPNGCTSEYPYRSYNGSCNNLMHKSWGMSQTAFSRLIDADYSDGVSAPRISALGDKLPNPRLVSSRLYSHRTLLDSNATLITMNFGLFIDHDIVQIAPGNGFNGSSISCCDPEIRKNPSLRHPECLEIDVPDFDCFYQTVNVTCMDFIRSRPIPGKCPGQREQMNLATSYLDGSAIYGSTDEKADELRSHEGGRLAGSSLNGTSMMPVENKKTCGTPKEPLACFVSGDSRVNENVDLAAVHNLWFREHNRIADELTKLNTHWDDERLFQEARRIVIAEFQHITYNEFLPLILGEEAMEKYHLAIKKNESCNDYDGQQDAGIYNVFAAAAYRFGHSLIQGLLHFYGRNYKPMGTVLLHETFLNPKQLFHGGFDNLLRGLVVQRTQSVESYMTTEVRDRLFQPSSGLAGLDLSAYGIQRGRDHGIAGYTAWRAACNMTAVRCWKDLYSIMDKEHVDRMRELYLTIDDVDLAPAALAEHHVEGSMLGPTYLCLLSKQFINLKIGDRFWYQRLNETWSFDENQLHEIYKASMSRLICDNSDRMTAVQQNAFRIISDTNPLLNCEDISSVNLTLWKE